MDPRSCIMLATNILSMPFSVTGDCNALLRIFGNCLIKENKVRYVLHIWLKQPWQNKYEKDVFLLSRLSATSSNFPCFISETMVNHLTTKERARKLPPEKLHLVSKKSQPTKKFKTMPKRPKSFQTTMQRTPSINFNCRQNSEFRLFWRLHINNYPSNGESLIQ